MKLDILNNKAHAYIIGLLQTDGNLYEHGKNKGRLSIEINTSDNNILYDISKHFDCNFSIKDRTRDIEIKGNNYISKTSSLTIYDLDTRNEFRKYIPSGKKSLIIQKPDDIIEVDYWRGVIDGDGSLGFTKKGLPFISLVTCSEILAEQYVDFLSNIIGYKKILNKNKRDKLYNIMVTNENSQKIISSLYYDGCISINRKNSNAQKIKAWLRPDNVKRIDFERRKWTEHEDNYIIEHDLFDSIEYLKRTKKSITIRLCRLNKMRL
jgi:hypothetical protein